MNRADRIEARKRELSAAAGAAKFYTGLGGLVLGLLVVGVILVGAASVLIR